MFHSRSLRIRISLLLLFLAPGALLAVQQAAAPVPAKKPGIKRIGLFATATSGEDATRQQLKELLQGDGAIIEVIPLINHVETLRHAEAERDACDLVLEANFELKPGKKDGGFLGKVTNVAKDVNQETNIGKSSQVRVSETDRRANTVSKMSKSLTPDPKDKVKVSYKLSPLNGKPLLQVQDKEVTAEELPKYLDKFLDDVVKESLK
jgi:hypothetical protein